MWFGSQYIYLLDDHRCFKCVGYSLGSTSNPNGYASDERYCKKEPVWSGFAISKQEMPYVAQTVVMGGNLG